MAFRAVLFDLDGTLINSTADIAWSANTLLERHGYPVHPLGAFNAFIGDGVTMLIKRILPAGAVELGSTEGVAKMVEEYRELYAGHWNVETYVYPGIEALVKRLKGEGILMAVLSNKPHDFTVQCVAHFLNVDDFELVMGAGGGFANKPDPAAALDIARRLEVSPAEFLYLGDTDTDMQTAVRAGMYPVGVTWGLRGREELALNGARSLIAQPGEVLRLMGRE